MPEYVSAKDFEGLLNNVNELSDLVTRLAGVVGHLVDMEAARQDPELATPPDWPDLARVREDVREVGDNLYHLRFPGPDDDG